MKQRAAPSGNRRGRVLLSAICAACLAVPTPTRCEATGADVPEPRETPSRAVLVAAPGTRDLSTIEEAVTAAGYVVRIADPDAFVASASEGPGRADLVVLVGADRLPLDLASAVVAHTDRGGDLIVLGAPAWSNPLVRFGDRYVPRDSVRTAAAADLPPHPIAGLAAADLDRWVRSAEQDDPPPKIICNDDGPAPGIPALRVEIPNLSAWETFGPPALDRPVPDGNDLTVFSARGAPATGALAVEWIETDGSRWIATVTLSTEWQRYVLAPGAFRYWPSVPERHATSFQPAAAATIRFGLARSHTGPMAGPHGYEVAAIGVGSSADPRLSAQTTGYETPHLDGISPDWATYAPSSVAEIRTVESPAWAAPGTSTPAPEGLHCLHPRPGGGGFDKGRDFRWIPLLTAVATDGTWRGHPAALRIHADGPRAGSAWASFAVTDPDWYRTADAAFLVRDAAAAIESGVFLVDGGADHYTYFDGDPVRLGARVVNIHPRLPRRVMARVRVTRPEDGSEVYSTRWGAVLGPGEIQSFEETWQPIHWDDGGWDVVVDLHDVGINRRRAGDVRDTPADVVQHRIHAWRPPVEPSYVEVRDGGFFLDGIRWRAHGVNYMPSSGIALEDWDAFEKWLGPRAYDPVVIDRDLRIVRDLGFNSISVFLYRQSMEGRNLLDLLRRADEFGLKVNLSLRPGTPLDFPWDSVREMIEDHHLAANDTVFAYDLAWEPQFGSHEDRRPWDRRWATWIVDRYGSVEAAETAWGCPVPRDTDDAVTNPLLHQVDGDGPWRLMTAAYRRFLDLLLHEKYGRARDLVRSIDPNHAVSFRMSSAGNPTFRFEGRIPYDFAGLAAAVDIFEPEAYGRIGDWERVRPGLFTATYARWANRELPVCWAEVGVSTLGAGRTSAAPELLDFQARYFSDIYRMLGESRADGVFFWWYPGGYRCGENSDFGLVNPDGTDRPACAVIRELGPGFLAAPPPRAPDSWIRFERSAHPDGLAGIYDKAADRFWGEIEAGRAPALRTDATGTTSMDCPPVTLEGAAAGPGVRAPLRHLEAGFDRFEVRGGDRWMELPVENGRRVALPPSVDGTDAVRITIANLGEAAWIPVDAAAGDDAAGAVRLVLPGRDAADRVTVVADLPCRVPARKRVVIDGRIPRTPGDGDPPPTLTLWTARTGPFGPRLEIAPSRSP